MKEAWRAKEKEREGVHLKRRKYSEAVRRNFMPTASEQKHSELMNEIL